MASKGFEVVGLDVSDTALAMCSERVSKACFKNTVLVKHEMLELPFIDNYFDSVLSTNVIHHAPLRQIKMTINEIHRVLEKNRSVLVTVASDSDYRNHTGRKIEDNTYVFTEGDEVGITHHFFKEDELARCFGRFEIFSLGEELIPVKEGHRGYVETGKTTRKIENLQRTSKVYFNIDDEVYPYKGRQRESARQDIERFWKKSGYCQENGDEISR